MTTAVDMEQLEQFIGQLVGYMTGGAMCFGVWLGDELGLYRVLTDIGPATADDVASKAGCNARLVREWLDAQVAGGLVSWDATADRYTLTPEAVMALAGKALPLGQVALPAAPSSSPPRGGSGASGHPAAAGTSTAYSGSPSTSASSCRHPAARVPPPASRSCAGRSSPQTAARQAAGFRHRARGVSTRR